MAKPGPKPRTEHERFWAKVNKNGPTPRHRSELGPCWLWTGAKIRHGYGHFGWGKTVKRVHIFSYNELVGLVPEGLELDHLCRNRLCVNPVHLEAVTHRVNVLRGTGMSARHAKKTHCINGHEFTPKNIYEHKPGCRECRECMRERDRWRYHNSPERREYIIQRGRIKRGNKRKTETRSFANND